MAVERENAVINEVIVLRAEFWWTNASGETYLYDPVEFYDVELLDEQNNVLDTIPVAAIVRDDTGKYHVDVGPYDDPLQMYDRWTFDNANSIDQYLHPGFVDVRRTDEDGMAYVPSQAAQTYINVFRQGTKEVMAGLAAYIYKAASPYQFVWAGVTDMYGRISVVLENEEYRIVLARDGYALTRNVFSLYVEGEQVNRRYVYTYDFPTQEPVVNRVPSDQLCLVKFYFARLDGRPIIGARVIADGSGVSAVDGTLAETIVIPYGPVETTTNAFGYADLMLVRGTQVDVYLENTTFQRTIEIPDQTEVNFADLAGGYDPLSALVLTPPQADVDIP